MDPVRGAGCVMTTLTFCAQSFESWTITVCAPAANPLKVPEAWNAPPSILNRYGAVPPDPETVTLPSGSPLHVVLVCAVINPDNADPGWVILTENPAVHDLASLTEIL